MLTDSTTLYWLAAASCVVVPALVCRAMPVLQNMSRAPLPKLRNNRPHNLTNPNSINSRERN